MSCHETFMRQRHVRARNLSCHETFIRQRYVRAKDMLLLSNFKSKDMHYLALSNSMQKQMWLDSSVVNPQTVCGLLYLLETWQDDAAGYGRAGQRGRLWKGRTKRQAMEGQGDVAGYGRAGRRGRLWKDRATRKSMEGQGDVAVFVFVGLSEQSTPERGERKSLTSYYRLGRGYIVLLLRIQGPFSLHIL